MKRFISLLLAGAVISALIASSAVASPHKVHTNRPPNALSHQINGQWTLYTARSLSCSPGICSFDSSFENNHSAWNQVNSKVQVWNGSSWVTLSSNWNPSAASGPGNNTGHEITTYWVKNMGSCLWMRGQGFGKALVTGGWISATINTSMQLVCPGLSSNFAHRAPAKPPAYPTVVVSTHEYRLPS